MDFNKIMEIGLEYAEKSKNAALDLAEKGKIQAKILNEQAKLMKAQRQLGALVYSLAKGDEENRPLVEKYIEMMDSIEQKIAQLKVSLTPAEVEEVERAQAEAVGEEIPVEEPAPEPEQPAADGPRCCPQCGAQVAEDALFCNKCGAQL